MQPHMIAAIDEQILACKEELSEILGGLIKMGTEVTCIHFDSKVKDKGWNYETVDKKIDEYTEMMDAFKERFQKINEGTKKKLHDDVESFQKKLTILKQEADSGRGVYNQLITDGRIARNKSILDNWDKFSKEIAQLIQDAENIVDSTR
jgi:Ni,Fe-hydrogenase III large subunit